VRDRSQSRSQRRTGQWTRPVRYGTGLSGATIRQRLERSTHRTAYSACPVAHRTVRCAHQQQPSPTAIWWLRAINTPNHHNTKNPSILNIAFNTRAIDSTSRHNQSDRSTQSLRINSSALGLVRESLVFICCSCLLGLAFFFFSILTLKCFVSKARDTNCLVVLAGSRWPVILRKKAHSV
jgi:hypothetical protein